MAYSGGLFTISPVFDSPFLTFFVHGHALMSNEETHYVFLCVSHLIYFLYYLIVCMIV